MRMYVRSRWSLLFFATLVARLSFAVAVWVKWNGTDDDSERKNNQESLYDDLVTADYLHAGFEETVVMFGSQLVALDISPDGTLMLLAEMKRGIYLVEGLDSADPTKTLVLDLSDGRMCTNGERGISGVAFHPDFPSNRWIYVYYTFNKYSDCYSFSDSDKAMKDRGPVNRLSRFNFTHSNRIDKSSEKVFLETPRFAKEWHNSGDISFGKDKHLYATIGDGHMRFFKNDAGIYYPQALDRLVGKIVRLTDEGVVPEDNPFTPSSGHPDSIKCGLSDGTAPNPSTKCQEIYAYGLRNPWRLAMDPNAQEVRFFVNDVGQHKWEEINECGEAFKGSNYGYPHREGPCLYGEDTACFPSPQFTDPVHYYHHVSNYGGAITAGAFLPDNSGWPQSLNRSYFYSDWAWGGISTITPGGTSCDYPLCDPPRSKYASENLFSSSAREVVAMKMGWYKGTSVLYYLSSGWGDYKLNGLYRIAYTGGSNSPPTAHIYANPSSGLAPLDVTFVGDKSYDPDENIVLYEWDFDNDGTMDAIGPNPSHTYNVEGTYYATLTVRDSQGASDTTQVRITVGASKPIANIISPSEGSTFAVGESLHLEASAFNSTGQRLSDVSLSWEVKLHHNDHWHPFFGPVTGNHIEVPACPPPEDFDASTTSYIEILLTAHDPISSLSTTTSQIVMPRTIQVTFSSSPSSIHFVAFGESLLTPTSIITWENHRFKIFPSNEESEGFELDCCSEEATQRARFGSSIEFSYHVTVASLNLNKTETHLYVNAGADEAKMLGGVQWQADTAYAKGGNLYESEQSIDTTKSRADETIYQTERYGDMTYTFTDLDHGEYLLRLHFAEIYSELDYPGGRIFDVVVQDKVVFDGVDVYASSGGLYVAWVLEVVVSVSSASLKIDFLPRVENPKVSGIELHSQ
mmetsp:Transcript_19994/g.43621  ORF Transcript_19994/g.43621 Transcript_19994/m.43621 type:complete len:913 (+) Transcript_19994:152-2890(+)